MSENESENEYNYSNEYRYSKWLKEQSGEETHTEDNIFTGPDGIFAKTRDSLLNALEQAKYLPIGQCPNCGYVIKRIECSTDSGRYKNHIIEVKKFNVLNVMHGVCFYQIENIFRLRKGL